MTADEDSWISVEDAQEKLSPHLETLNACVHAGWQAWRTKQDADPAWGMAMTPTTRAGIVIDSTWAAARERFAHKLGAHFPKRKQGLRSLCIADEFIIRFKKFTRQLRSSNILTKQQRLLENQLPLEGIPKLTWITLGYVLNRANTDIDAVAITLQAGKKIVWSLRIDQGTTIDLTNFTSVADIEPQSRTRRVKAKISGEEKTG